MNTRRKFLKKGLFGTFGFSLFSISNIACSDNSANQKEPPEQSEQPLKPTVVSTWNHGVGANEAALKIIESGGSALDAVEKGVMVTEADPESTSVGFGGLPDRDGNVTLDACIMNEKGQCGAVCFLQHIKHPISVARKVMEETPHVMLAGKGAFQFALSQGFKKENLLTEKAKEAWEEWLVKSEYKPIVNRENHDTIGMLALDQAGNISGACTTSGMAYKMHGRVGDSPIIGAGLYLDNEVGGCVATGHGEKVIETVGSFLVVELMRNGRSPQEACDEAIRRIVKRNPDFNDIQIGYIALDKKGNYGASCIHKGFNFALYQDGENELIDADYYNKG
ncbi:MAG: N(4)-(beta-N-acetylglucosaminyl)-L-asparaginase [Bacteroidota bacterium]